KEEVAVAVGMAAGHGEGLSRGQTAGMKCARPSRSLSAGPGGRNPCPAGPGRYNTRRRKTFSWLSGSSVHKGEAMSRIFWAGLLVTLLATAPGPAAKPRPLDALVRVLADSDDPAVQKDILRGMGDALAGRRNLKAPAGWSA